MSRNPDPQLAPVLPVASAPPDGLGAGWLFAALLFIGWLGGPVSGFACEAGIPVGEVLEVRTTAYTHSEASHLKYGARNAVGERLRYGKVRSAAADWSRFPLGTRFRIPGCPEVYEIDDYGSALVGTGTIDLYKPDAASMRRWGVRHIEIEVIEWGCFEESLEVLLPRVGKAPHIAAMVRGIRAKTKGRSEVAEAVPAGLRSPAGRPLAPKPATSGRRENAAQAAGAA
jgi:3D (Asp-Asp-Asp) domain-containing protein